MLFLKPYRLALDMDMMLLGPGVKVVKNTYDKKVAIFGMRFISLIKFKRMYVMINDIIDNIKYV